MKEASKKEKRSRSDEQREQLVAMVLENLKTGTGLWKQGWAANMGVPRSAITGKKYRGVNNLFLTYAAWGQGWSDNRWVTYNQMQEKGWTFKKDAEGNILAKKKGVRIVFFEWIDKLTGKRFDEQDLSGMSKEEREEYRSKYVRPLRKAYTVFNGDLIEGMPEREKNYDTEADRAERAERLIGDWDKNESKIVYGGTQAYYAPKTDEIHLPNRGDFYSAAEFYSTALHEMSHSTGHEKRLNRVMSTDKSTPEYAMEELRAELSSMFLAQELGIGVDENGLENNSAYIKNWYDAIKADPNALFTAIADAEKIMRYMLSKEPQKKRQIEPYAILENENEYGGTDYALYLISDYGQTRLLYISETKEELIENLEYFKSAPFWSDTEFREVSYSELIKQSLVRAKKSERETEKSDIFLPPSELVARSLPTFPKTEAKMESLTRMSDREVIERAKKATGKETFLRLYNGESVLGSETKDERSLMSRLALFCDGDKDKLLRIFKASGQYREEKPNGVYEQMAEDSLLFVSKIRGEENLETRKESKDMATEKRRGKEVRVMK